jgi:hypothetical protein
MDIDICDSMAYSITQVHLNHVSMMKPANVMVSDGPNMTLLYSLGMNDTTQITQIMTTEAFDKPKGTL